MPPTNYSNPTQYKVTSKINISISSRRLMALVVYWYDFVCFGIVGFSFLGALLVIWRKERGSRLDDNTVFNSLLDNRPDSDGFGGAMPRSHVGSSQLWTTCWRGLHPGWLLATRFLSFLIMAGFLSWDIVEWDATIFVYYTEWTFAIVMLYFALGTVVSAHGCWVISNNSPSRGGERNELLKTDVEESRTAVTAAYRENEIRRKIKLQSHHAEEEIQQRAGFWGYLMQISYQTCAGAVILTDVVFWCVIVPFLSNSHLGLNMLMGCMHTLNAVFLLIDTTLGCLPFPWFRLAYFVLLSCIYVAFQWVIHACGFTWWPYPFLELDTPWAPLWYFAMAVVHIPCYGAYALIVKGKNWVLPKLFPHAFIRSY